VRAARNAECSGESLIAGEFLKRLCVKTTAKAATRAMFPVKGGPAVDAVFDEAYADVSPPFG
jgi:hypothetical protein